MKQTETVKRIINEIDPDAIFCQKDQKHIQRSECNMFPDTDSVMISIECKGCPAVNQLLKGIGKVLPLMKNLWQA